MQKFNALIFVKFCIFGILRKTLSIFFLTIYLISSTEFNQLMKFPLFIKHFIVHKDQDSQLTLERFIAMHYADQDINDADQDEDMKLPFKTHNTCLSSSSVSFVPANLGDLTIKVVSSEQKFYSNYHEKFLPSSYLSSIWQPPKSC